MVECIICRERFGSSPQLIEKDRINSSLIDSSDGTFKVAVVRCGHMFHYKCILEWLSCKGSSCKCPICNKKVIRSYLTVIYHDWNEQAEPETSSGLDSFEAQRLINENKELHKKLSISAIELQRSKKDLSNLRRHLKFQLQEESKKNQQLINKINKLKSYQSGTISAERKRRNSLGESINPSPKKSAIATSINEARHHICDNHLTLTSTPTRRFVQDLDAEPSDLGVDRHFSVASYAPGFANYFGLFNSSLLGFGSNLSTLPSEPPRAVHSAEASSSLNLSNNSASLSSVLRVDLSKDESSPRVEQVIDLTDPNVLDLTCE